MYDEAKSSPATLIASPRLLRKCFAPLSRRSGKVLTVDGSRNASSWSTKEKSKTTVESFLAQGESRCVHRASSESDSSTTTTTGGSTISSCASSATAGRRVRFDLSPNHLGEQDKLHTSELGERSSASSSMLKRRKVRFNLSSNQYLEREHIFSKRELGQCWYTDSELREIKDEHSALVSRLFNKDNEWRETMKQAYSECRKVKKGNMDCPSGQVDRQRLAQVYEQHGDLVGMEKYVLFSLRGSAAKQVFRLLDSMSQNEGDRKAFLRKCQSMTQPSSILVRELALAQAAAVSQT